MKQVVEGDLEFLGKAWDFHQSDWEPRVVHVSNTFSIPLIAQHDALETGLASSTSDIDLLVCTSMNPTSMLSELSNKLRFHGTIRVERHVPSKAKCRSSRQSSTQSTLMYQACTHEQESERLLATKIVRHMVDHIPMFKDTILVLKRQLQVSNF